MNFDFSDDQKLLKEQVRKFLTDKCPTKVVRRVLDGNETHADEVWKGLVDLGVPGVGIPEEYGGLGLSPLELCVVAEEIGRVAAPVPFDTSVVLATEALKLAGSDAQKKKWLPELAAGKAIGTLAVAEGPQPPKPRTIAHDLRRRPPQRQEGAGGRRRGCDLRDRAGQHRRPGRPRRVAGAGRSRAGRGDQEACRDHRSGAQACRAHLQGRDRRAAGRATARAGACWSACTTRRRCYFAFAQVGGAEAAMWMARDYALQRQAFGRAIGSYQAIKHKLADCYVKIELARSNAYYGAMMLTDGGADLPLAAAAARIAATEAYDFASKENIQTHGGIGFTWEADTQFHYRRARLHGAVDRRADGLEGQAGEPSRTEERGLGQEGNHGLQRHAGRSRLPQGGARLARRQRHAQERRQAELRARATTIPSC